MMNNYFDEYREGIKRQWRDMDLVSKTSAVLICSLLLISGFVTGIFILSTSLLVAIVFYIKSAIDRRRFNAN